MKITNILKKTLGFRGNVDAQASAVRGAQSLSTFYYLRHKKEAVIGMAIIAVFVVWSVIEGSLQLIGSYLRKPSLGWLLLPHNPISSPNVAKSLLPPSPAYPFGTNFEGQDILSRLLYAAPKDAIAAFAVVVSAVIIGALFGIVAGYYGGWVDEILMRVTDAFLAIPGLILAIALSILIGPGFNSVLISLTIIWWPVYARLFRGQTLTLKYRGFVEISRLFGVSEIRVLFKHILMNAIDPIIAYMALDFGTVILTYSTLAFLGIGVQPPYPEWGSMASDGLSFFPRAWWYTFFPSITILLIVIGFILFGDSFQDVISGRVVD
ncbi:MAG: ABC transporter permease [Thermoprotei archaeon]